MADDAKSQGIMSFAVIERKKKIAARRRARESINSGRAIYRRGFLVLSASDGQKGSVHKRRTESMVNGGCRIVLFSVQWE